MTQVQRLLLHMVALSLFGADMEAQQKRLLTAEAAAVSEETLQELRTEARKQAVYPLLRLPSDKQTYALVADNLKNEYQHKAVHTLLTDRGIPYVILKGWASAAYYPEPQLRSMGDVDFLVDESDFDRASAALVADGFTPVEDIGGIHVAFHREGSCPRELHRRINGENETVRGYLADMLQKTRLVNGMRLPSDFHHALVLLCHTASHMTATGVGLRHLCDWAVFVRRVDVSVWEAELKHCGLWRFARTLSLMAAQYLFLPYQAWFGTDEKQVAEALMEDILEGGNFGKKDKDRLCQNKYIANRESLTIGRSFPITQAWVNVKAKAGQEGISAHTVLLRHLRRILSGERRMGTPRTLQEAHRRKELYRKLELFRQESERE